MSLNLNMYHHPPKMPPSLSDIHAFAQTFLRIFSNDSMPEKALSHPTFGILCKKLGFSINKGKSFSEIWSPEAYADPASLSEIIAEVDDPILLGNVIFSKWWDVCSDPTMSINTATNRTWFVLALEQLCGLSSKYEPLPC